MRNPALTRLHPLEGRWELTLSDAWFLEPRDTVLHGQATIEWLGEAFLVVRSDMDGKPMWDLVIGHSDAQERYVLLYHDERGVGRVFDMTFGEDRWEFTRADPDFHQRFVADVTADRIAGRCDASEDGGATWRKDFDLVFARVQAAPA